MKAFSLRATSAAALAASLLLAGCSLPTMTHAPDSAQPAIPGNWQQASADAPAVQSAWWLAFGDAQLSRWVELALQRNNDVLTAAARVDEATGSDIRDGLATGYLYSAAGRDYRLSLFWRTPSG